MSDSFQIRLYVHYLRSGNECFLLIIFRHINEQSKMIPVLGHAEGVCHVYIDDFADVEKAVKIVKDAKTDYPSACNAMETLLFHEDLVDTPMFHQVCQMLKHEGVQVFTGKEMNWIH